MSAETASSSFLDSAWMRLIAVLIAVCGVALFIVTNQHLVANWFGGDVAEESEAYEACIDERMEAVETLAEEANYTAKQKELAVIRAEEFCRNQTGG